MMDNGLMRMAELQWAVQVKCVNALLAEVKVGEKGELIIVNAPGRNLGPSELDKLIEGLEVAGSIAKANRKSCAKPARGGLAGKASSKSRGIVKVLKKRDLYELSFLKTGEIVNVNVPDMLFTPSELDAFIAELKAVRNKMEGLRKKLSRGKS
jgi:hypothetical protein